MYQLHAINRKVDSLKQQGQQQNVTDCWFYLYDFDPKYQFSLLLID